MASVWHSLFANLSEDFRLTCVPWMCTMDPATEKQLATLLMEEATRLRQQADREGVHVYLAKPKVRGRPNSQFLTATMRGVQQANRMVEVNEMWRLREKELELEQRMCICKDRFPSEQHRYTRSGNLRHNSVDRSNSKHKSYTYSKEGQDLRNPFNGSGNADSPEMGDEGLRDEEIEDFLQSRAKRGRGAVGSRMDEPGPYLMPREGESSSPVPPEVRVKEDWEQGVIGPSMPPLTGASYSVCGLENLKGSKLKKDRAKLDSNMHEDADEDNALKKIKGKTGKKMQIGEGKKKKGKNQKGKGKKEREKEMSLYLFM
eukprot:Gb_41734 [translate_table: standard]